MSGSSLSKDTCGRLRQVGQGGHPDAGSFIILAQSVLGMGLRTSGLGEARHVFKTIPIRVCPVDPDSSAARAYFAQVPVNRPHRA